jgi:hypothetical protein
MRPPGITLTAPPRATDAEIAAVVRVLRSGHLVQGREVAAFEAEFGALVNGQHCIAVNSGTAALHLCLLALGIGPGDEVIVPSFTFPATAHAVAITGAQPVFADIDPVTYCIDPPHVESLITSRTAALLPVHLFGHPAAMPELTTLARRHGLAVVEDAAQAVAATLHGRPVGTHGDLTSFSFYPTKNMHSIEGGMITTADPRLAQTLRLLRNQGISHGYRCDIVGLNARMTDVAAAIGRIQLATLGARTHSRRVNAAWLTAHLTSVVTPVVSQGAEHVFHQYVIRTPDRDRLAARLTHARIGTAVHYPTPVHRTPAYARGADLPQTDTAAAQVLSLPVHPALSRHDLTRIPTVVNGSWHCGPA